MTMLPEHPLDVSCQPPSPCCGHAPRTSLLVQSSLDLRITALMVAGGHVWLGTGAGTVAIFSVEVGVADPVAAIAELARRAAEVKAVSCHQQWRASMAGAGLVRAAEQLSEERDEQVEETEEEKSGPKSRYHPQERSQEFRRKTQFGRTLRRDRNRSMLARRQSEQMIYQLKLAANRQVVSQSTEAVRVLLPLKWVACGWLVGKG